MRLPRGVALTTGGGCPKYPGIAAVRSLSFGALPSQMVALLQEGLTARTCISSRRQEARRQDRNAEGVGRKQCAGRAVGEVIHTESVLLTKHRREPDRWTRNSLAGRSGTITTL